MKRKQKISPDELKKIAENQLRYVIWMLNQTATLSAKPESPKNNAYIESFVIHARILIEFLYGKPTAQDTILASDYVDGWWDNYISKNKPLEKSEFIKNIKKKANLMAAHLTKAGSMYSDKDKEWDRIRIRDDINKIILKFLEAVPDDSTISRETKLKIKSIINDASGPKGLPPDSIMASGLNATELTGITGATGPQQ